MLTVVGPLVVSMGWHIANCNSAIKRGIWTSRTSDSSEVYQGTKQRILQTKVRHSWGASRENANSGKCLDSKNKALKFIIFKVNSRAMESILQINKCTKSCRGRQLKKLSFEQLKSRGFEPNSCAPPWFFTPQFTVPSDKRWNFEFSKLPVLKLNILAK